MGRWSCRFTPLRQTFLSELYHGCPVASRCLPKQPRAGIPGTILPVEQPAPVIRVRDQYPHRPAQRASDVNNTGVDAHNQIEQRHDCGGVAEIFKRRSGVEDMGIRMQNGALAGGGFLLKTDKLPPF